MSANTTFYAIWTSNEFYWVNNSSLVSGYPSTITVSESNPSGLYYRPNFPTDLYAGTSDQSWSIKLTTGTVSTKGCKYMAITFSDLYGCEVSVNGTWVANGSTTVDVSSYSSVYITFTLSGNSGTTAWAKISSIKFYN